MNTIIQNEHITVTCKSLGAALTSIQKKPTQTEYLWQGDSHFWNGQAPVLFPIVGQLINNTYFYNGQSYEMKRHGLARISEFDICTCTDTSVQFLLRANETLKQAYPFDFEFYVTYSLEQSTLTQAFTVVNKSPVPMPFGLGGHPGFNCPLYPGETMEDYYLEFEKKEDFYSMTLADNAFIGTQKKLILQNDHILPLRHSLFDDDALIFHNLASRFVTIKNRKNTNSVTVSLAGWEYVGIWSALGDAPFVCIEPWTSTADAADHNGNIFKKIGIQSLPPNETYCNHFTILIQ